MSDGLTAAAWARVTAFFDEARTSAPADAAGRDAWLRAHVPDESTRGEVAAMLATYHADPNFLEPSPDLGGALSEALGGGLIGRRLGAYRLVREVGRGGMGLVYEARRDDQEFDRRAAVKILPAWSAAWQAQRFRFERQILAGLDHPGIAHLLDAGTTDDGIPYFVMEFVDGQPIDAWCRERGLGPSQRVQLVERVCDAIAFAHQHLVVHRDVKPANILVTAAGEPKLLDFGISALLTGDGEAAGGATRTGQHSFTPRYASPEQIRGERVTTATDVYSLGVLLYLLLADREPFPLTGASPFEVMRIVCEDDPPPMSAVAPAPLAAAIRGDLDAIVAKALAKRPAERYRTVVDLVADLRAWRERRPVTATPPTVGYRASRFVRRNRGPLAAAATLAVAVAIGIAATVWQARLAERERNKAQNRFREVQAFSRSLLFDVHDAISGLPGATEPRRLLLNRAVQLLDGLAVDAAGDDALQMELVEGYRRLGIVQGSTGTQNVGDVDAAIASFRKAADLIEARLAARPGDAGRIELASRVYELLAGALQSSRRTEPARQAHERHLRLLDAFAAAGGGRLDDGLALANGYTGAGIFCAIQRDLPAARGFYEKALAILDRRPPGTRAAGERRRPYTLLLKRLGAVEMVTGHLDASERHYRAALALEEEAIRQQPSDLRLRFDQTFTLTDLGEAIRERGRVDDALTLWRRALAVREAAVAADPHDTRARVSLASLQERLARGYRRQRGHQESIGLLREALRHRDLMLERQPGGIRAVEREWTRLSLAGALADAAETGGAGAAAALAEARALAAALDPSTSTQGASDRRDDEFAREHAALRVRLAARPDRVAPVARPARQQSQVRRPT